MKILLKGIVLTAAMFAVVATCGLLYMRHCEWSPDVAAEYATEHAEYQIKDRTSFRDFIGICTVDDVPDARTIWKYREELTQCGAYDELFKQFYAHLQRIGTEILSR